MTAQVKMKLPDGNIITWIVDSFEITHDVGAFPVVSLEIPVGAMKTINDVYECSPPQNAPVEVLFKELLDNKKDYKCNSWPNPTTNNWNSSDVIAPLTKAIPKLGTPCQCPHISDNKQCLLEGDIMFTVIHLNDQHGWTREEIADWLETLDVDLSFPTPNNN